MVERVVAEVDVVMTSTAQILAAFASVAGVVLGTGISNLHDYASAVTSTVSTAVVLTTDLESAAAHGCRAGGALALAQVLVPAVVTIASGASWIRGIVLTAAANVSNPELGAIGGCAAVTTL